MMTRCCWHDDDMMKRLPLDTWNANRALATVSCTRCQLHLPKVLDISSGVLYLNITTSHRDVTGMVLRIGGTILHPHMSELSMVGELSINSEVSFEDFWGADEWPGAVLSSCYHHVIIMFSHHVSNFFVSKISNRVMLSDHLCVHP